MIFLVELWTVGWSDRFFNITSPFMLDFTQTLFEALEQSPGKQSNGTDGETPNNDPVLDAVSLEAECHNMLFLGILAYIEVLTEAEGLCAGGA